MCLSQRDRHVACARRHAASVRASSALCCQSVHRSRSSSVHFRVRAARAAAPSPAARGRAARPSAPPSPSPPPRRPTSLIGVAGESAPPGEGVARYALRDGVAIGRRRRRAPADEARRRLSNEEGRVAPRMHRHAAADARVVIVPSHLPRLPEGGAAVVTDSAASMARARTTRSMKCLHHFWMRDVAHSLARSPARLSAGQRRPRRRRCGRR